MEGDLQARLQQLHDDLQKAIRTSDAVRDLALEMCQESRTLVSTAVDAIAEARSRMRDSVAIPKIDRRPHRMSSDTFAIRRASPEDAAAIVAVWQSIVAERVFAAVHSPFPVDQERAYLASLSEREAVFLAETGNGQVIGFQSLDQWTKLFHSMD